MGSCLSCFKQNDTRESLLSNSVYCDKCGQMFIYNEYQKHIITCNKPNIPEIW